ncbi:hypothetical protein BAUCODRAFT_61115, partial [Baudoinia panamericana UAMH 10762]
MAATYSSASAAATTPRNAAYVPPARHSAQPAGTFLPGTKVQVGNVRVVIEKYLSEGGFAHVYVVRIPRDNHKYELAVLKRVAVPDREHLANMRTEVETMKKLKGHKHVVTYMDSHASQLKGGGYEVFLLMEYCSGGGLIDFMNTRLQHRLTEPEILKIFGDVAEGVACMHYLKPPLLHRDLKVENVLIAKSASAGTPTYKVCDFGSAASPRPAAKTAEEGRLIEEDVQKHTTMQYRSPEMIDVWRKQPIDEKADIWALGVLLYKLCYYTTPFEDVGQMAILNASYKYPSYPSFSDRLKKLIAWTLKEDPTKRPNIYQLIKEVCNMRGTEVPIKDIYAERTQSEARRNQSLPSPDPPISSPPVGLQKATPKVEKQSVPDIAPMRRGRLPGSAQQAGTAPKPSPSPSRGDPFAALDSKTYEVRAGAVDELSKRFPSLDEFSIAVDKGGKVAFPPTAPNVMKGPEHLSERVTNALADQAFSQSKPTADMPKAQSTAQLGAKAAPKAASVLSAKGDRLAHKPTLVHQPTPVRPGDVRYTSTGVGSSPPPFPKPANVDINHRPVWRVPDIGEPSIGRAKSAQARQRPSSVYVSSNLDFLRDQESSRSKRPSLELSRRQSRQESQDQTQDVTDDAPIENDMDYLRVSEDSDIARTQSQHRKASSGHKKRVSLPQIPGAKSIFSGRLGDAFKRFERSDKGETNDLSTMPQPQGDEGETAVLSPIESSETTPRKLTDDTDLALDESQELPPDVRRELERRRLSQEEKRVAEAAAEHRARVAAQGTGGAVVPTRASTIQKRVQSLLDEGRQSPVPKKTAEGYGKYTEQDSEH